MKVPKKILIVEDELVIAMDIKITLESNGYDILEILTDSDETLEYLKDHKPDLIIVDIIIEGSMNGIELTQKINEMYKIPVVYISALLDKVHFKNAQDTNPICYLVKPYRESELLNWIDKTLN